ncbi:MAG: DNRLRE domain-containing protein [bacterium]
MILRSLLVTLLMIACNTLPVGFDQINRLPETATIELVPDSVDSYAKFVPLGAADHLLLGKDQQYQSRVLIDFALKDSALDSVVAVQLVLFTFDSTATNFICRACSTEWSSSAVTWRMADSLTQWFTPGGDYWNFSLGQGQMQKESTVVEFNRNYLDTLVHHSYGVALIPLDTGFTNIAPLTVNKKAPRLILNYANSKKRIYYPAADAHIIDSSGIRTNPGELIVGAGVAFRTWLHFRLESIPDSATIAQAELIFKPQTIYRRFDTLRIGIHRLTESYHLRNRYAIYDEKVLSYTNYTPGDTEYTVHLSLTELVQHWVSEPDSYPNYGLLLTATPEWQKPFRMKIFRSGTQAPKLKIRYILPPEDRFSR